MRLTTIIILILIIGAVFIVTTQKIDLGEKEGKVTFAKAFVKWIVQISSNLKDLTMHAISQNWIPEEENKTDSHSKQKDIVVLAIN